MFQRLCRVRRFASLQAIAALVLFAGLAGLPSPAAAGSAGPPPRPPHSTGTATPVRTEAAPTGPATNLQFTGTGSGSADISWTAANWGSSANLHYSVLVTGSNGTVTTVCASQTGTTCHVTGSAGATVGIVVRALGDSAGEYSDSTSVTTTLLPPPAAPGSVIVTASGSLQGQVHWTAPSSWHLSVNRKYDVLIDGTAYPSCTAITALTCTFQGTSGVHAVTVRADGDPGLSTSATPVNVTLVTAPGAPTNIHLTTSDAGTGTIAWTPPDWLGNTNNTYTVTVDGDQPDGCVGITATTCSFEADEITVPVVVTAIGDAPNLTTDSATVMLTLLPPPAAPGNVHAVAWSAGSATVQWNPADFKGSGNNTYSVTSGGSPVAGCTDISGTQCVVTGPADSTTSVVVTANGDVGLATASTPATIELPANPDAPTTVHVTARTLGHTRVEWTAPTSWHHNTANQTYDVTATGATGCTATANTYCDVTGGQNSTSTVTVRATGDDPTLHADSTATPIEVPGVPAVPTNVHVTATTSGAADIAWTESDWQHNTSRTYAVTVNGSPVTCADATVAACHITGAGPTTPVTVQAIGDDAATLSSAASAPVQIPLVVAPIGTVSAVTVTATAGSAHIAVSWPTLTANGGSWSSGATHKYTVTIDSPSGAILSSNSCAQQIDDSALTCAFDTDTDGTYTAHVTAVNEAGSATSGTQGSATLVLHAPTGQVTNLQATTTPAAGTVPVSWTALAAAAWHGATTQNYVVLIDAPNGATVTGSCGTPTATTSCSFTTNTAGAYTVHVTPTSEAGAGTGITTVANVALIVPSAAVTGLTMQSAPGSGVISLAWTALSAADWQGATHHLAITVTKPSGAVLSSDSCAPLATADATSAASCQFTTDTAGDYSVDVRAMNEVGTSTSDATATDHVTLGAPQGPLAGLTVTPTPGSGTVAVTWTRLSNDAAWGNSTTRQYVATVTGPQGAVITGTCTSPITDAPGPGCSFTTNLAGDYSVSVVAHNEAGDSAAAQQTGHVTLVAPTGTVTGLTVSTTPQSGVVTLAWNQLPDAGWSTGQTRTYAVTVGGGTNVTTTTCTSVTDSASPGCSFTTDTPGAFTASVAPVNEAGTGTGTASGNGNVAFQPTASVAGVTAAVSVGSPTVSVHWTQAATADWRGGTTRHYVVSVSKPTGAALANDTCTTAPVADSSMPGCSFGGSLGGDYVVSVVLQTEAGTSTGTVSSATGHLTLVPTAQVTNLHVVATAGSPDLSVVWHRAATADWNGGTTHNYVATLTSPNGATITANDCGTVADSSSPGCSFTTNTAGSYTVVVALANEAGTSTATATDTATLALVAPSAAVTGLAVTTTPGSGIVSLSWTGLQAAAWQGATHHYAITVTKPSGAVVSGDFCSTLASADATSATSCQFTTDTAGDYSVVMRAVNEVGTSAQSATASGHVTLSAPQSAVSGLTVTPVPGSGTVPVTWNQLTGNAAWGSSATRQYVVTVTGPQGASVTGTCTTVPDGANPGCSFTTTTAGDYTVSVVANNEAGSGTAAQQTGHVTLTVPSGTVTGLAVDNTPSSGVVNLSWNQLAAAGFAYGATRTYTVTITGTSTSASTCAVVTDSAHPQCSFTATTPGQFGVTVTAVNELGAATTGTGATGHIAFVPTATVTGLTATTTPGSSSVHVAWNSLNTPDWNGGATKQYLVTVSAPSGAVVDDDDCISAPVNDSASPGCDFDGSAGGDYTVHVAVSTEAGAAAPVSTPVHLVLVPAVMVHNLAVASTPGQLTATVTWDALADADWNGGTSRSYTVTVTKPSGATLSGNSCTSVDASASPACAFTTDQAGAYMIEVAPTNESGIGSSPAVVNKTLTLGAPGAPTGVTATPGVNSIAVAWTAPDGAHQGSGIASYAVTATTDNYPAVSCPSPVASPCNLTGLSAGVVYTVHVVAQGPGGSSTDGTGNTTATPTGTVAVPDAVPSTAVDAGSSTGTTGAQITLTGSGYAPGTSVALDFFSVPQPVGSTVASSIGTISVTVSVPAGLDAGSHTLLATGLAPGGAILYLAKTVTVSAAPTTTPTTPATTPPTTPSTPVSSAPTSAPATTRPTGGVGSLAVRQVSASDGTALVSWTAGTLNWGTGSEHSYAVSVDGPDGATITGTCTQAVDGAAGQCGFQTDTSGIYVIAVVARTEAGISTAAASISAKVVKVPVAPASVTGIASANAVSVNWTNVPSGEVTGYLVTAAATGYPTGTCAGKVTHGPCRIAGLSAGVAYTLRVVATSTGGNSAAAAATGSVYPTGSLTIPAALPAGAPTIGTRTAAAGGKFTIAGTGYKAATALQLRLYPGNLAAGTAKATASGSFTATATVPKATANGKYTLLVIGLNAAGRARFLAVTVTVGKTGGKIKSAAAGSTTGATSTTGKTGKSVKSESAMPITGREVAPVFLAGFTLVTAGLMLTLAAWRRREPALGRHALFPGRHTRR